MLDIELLLLLMTVGCLTGALSALIRTPPELIAIPSLVFFLPLLGLSIDDTLVPIVATCIVAFIPVCLYRWVSAMQKQTVDMDQLTKSASGVAMGAVIGAQLLSFSPVWLFYVGFTGMSLFASIDLLRAFFTKI
ncbi:hypothetical protein [Marinomonas algarum]|uniref:Uncharacterized protein n=1 Tax=Marinomonas algarum TaxID=2883105 RepID=A0A9X1IMG0_9GAMM|nr:hypothetical protein [Marinomonas algarum]MCB5161928.1 hypothetical protein [Marinomonas algarum]